MEKAITDDDIMQAQKEGNFQPLNPMGPKTVKVNLPTYLAQKRTNIVIQIENQKEGTLQIFDEMATLIANQHGTLAALTKEKEALVEELKQIKLATDQQAPTK